MRNSGDVGGRPDVTAVTAADEFGLGAGVSYRIIECSSERRSNARSERSAPTETKMSTEPGSHATSYTSRSCAMSWVTASYVSRFQTVHVMSMEDVTTSFGDFSFHAKLVMGTPGSRPRRARACPAAWRSRCGCGGPP